MAWYTVESVEEGWYSLRDSNIEMEQWELLESRFSEDGGVSNSPVTLEEDLRRYIRSLLSWHELMYRSLVPFQKGVQPVGTDGMLDDWSKRELSSEEREQLESVASMRRLSKLAFVNTSVADIFHALPVRATREGDTGHDEANFLRAFASSKGSLCRLDGLGGLREHGDFMDENDRKLMVRMSGDDLHGAYPSHINYAMQLLQYSYRLTRPISFYEAYLPICAGERKVLSDHFDCWRDNEKSQEDFSVEPFRINGDPKKMTVAMRFSLERCNEVIPNIPPAMVKVLSKDDGRYGTLIDKSNHPGTFTKAAKALPLLKCVMQRDPELGLEESGPTEFALGQVYNQAGKFLQAKRNEAGEEEGRESGLKGVAKKARKGNVPFARLPYEESFELVKFLLRGMYINGMKRVLDAIDEIDGKCLGDDGWCYDILRVAEVASTSVKKRPVFTEKQLRGVDEVQRRRIAAVVEGLKSRGIRREHFELASAATGVRDMVSPHPLRNQGFFFRRWANFSVNGRRESRNPGRMVAGLPPKNNLSKHGHGSGNGVAREHVIDVDCGYWNAVTNVIGRAFFESFDDPQGELSPYIGPVDARGGVMAQKRFNGIVKKIGRAYLAVENLTIMQFRTACCTLVMS
ncbi:unnamed protein product [Ectocarpus sp. 6 AP-2014]